MVTETRDRKGSTTTKQIALAGCVGMAPPPEAERLPCPRCHSTNTKFCYYNNYNFSQPRHFCKNCRRYWTQGGTLRDIPVGGGTRKNAKRSRTMSSATAATAAETTTMQATPAARTNELAGMTFGSNTQLGSFTSLLSEGCTNGFLGLGFGGFGFGLGVEDAGFLGGLGTRSGGMCNFPDTWQVESAGEAGFLSTDYAAVSSQGTSLLK